MFNLQPHPRILGLHQGFLIYIDASDYRLEAILSQIHEGKDQPISYASRHLNKTEAKYSTIEKEAAAMIF